MSNVYAFTKQTFSWSVIAMTILWSMGVSALVPLVAQAASCSFAPGDVVKGPDSPAVYMVTEGGEIQYFPNGEVYDSWGRPNPIVVCDNMGDVELATPPGVIQPPGEFLVKNMRSAAVYAVQPGNKIVHITSGEVMEALYGANWTTLLRDAHDFHWNNYTKNGEHTEMMAHWGMTVTKAGLGKNYYVNEELQLVELTGTIPAHVTVRTLAAAVFDAHTMATGQTKDAATLNSDPTQGDTAGSTPTTPTDPTTPTTPTPTGGDLSVSLSANTPAAANVPINVDGVTFTKVVLKAMGGDVTVNALKLQRDGLGATGDFTSVTVYDEAGVKIGQTKTSWASDNTMTYNIAGGLVIKDGMSKELSVNAKLDTAGTYNKIGVADVTVAAGSVNGTPVFGNTMSGINVTVGGVHITGQGTATQTKKIGATDVELAKFRLTVSSTEDTLFHSITLKNKGTASDSDLGSLTLWTGGNKVAGPVASLSSDKVRFVLDEAYALDKSKNADFTVKGDIVNGDTRTAEFVLDTATDINMTGKTYNTRLRVSDSLFDAAGDSGTTVTTIDGAELNISFTNAAFDTADDRKDIEFGRLTLSAGTTDIKLTTMIFGMDETDGNSDVTDNEDVDEFELVDASTGDLFTGTMSDGGDDDDDTEVWTFSDELYLSAGTPRTFIMRGDLPTGIGSGDSYRVTSTINTTNWVAETVPEGDSVSNFSIGSITGKLVTVRAATLTVRASAMNNTDAVINQEGVLMWEGSLEAISGDVHVERLRFEGGTTTASDVTLNALNMDADNWSAVQLVTVKDGVETVRQTLTSSELTDGELDFSSLDFWVTQGSANKVTFRVKGSLRGSLTSNTTVHLQLDTITARDKDNDTVTAQNSSGAAIATAAELEITGAITLRASGVLYVSIRDTDAGFNKDRIFLAGSSEWVGKMVLRADFEDVLLQDLKFSNSNSTTNDSVDSVCLYKSTVADAANLVSCTTLDTSGVAFFDDVNVNIPKGTHTWYVYVTSLNMGNGAGETADTHDILELGVGTTTSDVAARGQGSGVALAFGDLDGTVEAGEIILDFDLDGTFDEAADWRTASTTQFEVAGSKITEVAFVTSHSGETVSSLLSGTGSYTAAIVKIKTASHNNKDGNGQALRMTINSLLFNVDKMIDTRLSGWTVQRIGGAVAAQTLSDAGANSSSTTDYNYAELALTTASSSLDADSRIDAGDTAYLVIKATVDAVSTTTGVVDWFRVDMDVLGTTSSNTSNSIDWLDGYNGQTGTDFDYLNLDSTLLTGIKIAESL